MKCDIIIPVWGQLGFTRDCVESIIKNTAYPYRLILVDNASDAQTMDYLEGLKGRDGLGVEIIRNDRNLGFVKAVNQGLKISRAPYVCILNNDTVPAPGWLGRMVEFAESHKDVGLINPQCNGHGDMTIEDYAKALEARKGRFMEMNQCQGFCMLVKREVIEKIGLLDESFGIGGFDDTDYSMRAHKAGYKSVAIGDAYVYHRLHGSFDKAGDREDWVKRNQKIYYDKWGKHLRVGIKFSQAKTGELEISGVMKFAYGLAREWSWVHIWINSRVDKALLKKSIDDILKREGLPPHQNIRINYFNLPAALFNLVILGKIAERMRRRMRDKRFDAVLSFNKLLSSSIGDGKIDWEEKGREAAFSIKKARDARWMKRSLI